jgi:hypothetical protein
LANPHTPARFANEAAFDDDLTRILNERATASWRKAMAPCTHGGGVRCVLCAIKYGQWRSSGGGGEPVGPPPSRYRERIQQTSHRRRRWLCGY